MALGACGGEGLPPDDGSALPSVQAPVTPPSAQPPASPVPPAPGEPQPPAGEVGFQPGFHQALRSSHAVSGVTTFRLRVPVQRAGTRVRVTFASGDGSLRLHRASVAKVDAQGAPLGATQPLLFDGSAGFEAEARTRRTSDPVALPVGAGDELAVTFEVQGALGASTIEAFPGSELRAGAYGDRTGALGGSPWAKAVGVATVDVEGRLGRAFVAVGDSITEGYVDGSDDTRRTWPAVASRLLGEPVVNAGVSGQGVFQAMEGDRLEREVLSLKGVTDCVVLLGTNDLGGRTAQQLTDGLDALVTKLEPMCRVWLGTLLPKDRTSNGTLSEVWARRATVNAWIATRQRVEGVIDFAQVLARPGDPNRLADGVHSDGIHPNDAGLRKLGEEAARVLAE